MHISPGKAPIANAISMPRIHFVWASFFTVFSPRGWNGCRLWCALPSKGCEMKNRNRSSQRGMAPDLCVNQASL
jgi:hypothetical protein